MNYQHALIIDDDPFMQHLLIDFIKALNIPLVSTAINGLLGINTINSHKTTPDLIILDVNMPILDGYQVIDYLAEHNYPGKTIIISGANHQSLIAAQLLAKWSNLSLGDPIIKPFSQSTLINSILS